MKKGWAKAQTPQGNEDFAPKTIASEVYVDDNLGKTVRQALEATVCLGDDKKIIYAKENLNNYKTPGSYTCPASLDAATLANCPTEHAFHLIVDAPLRGSYYIMQTLITFMGSHYVRWANAASTAQEGWSAWKKMITESDSTSFEPTVAKGVKQTDSRSMNPGPYDNAAYPVAGIYADFKANGTDGLSDGGYFHRVMTYRAWNDTSGGNPVQVAFTDSGNMWMRTATSGTAWGAWQKISKNQVHVQASQPSGMNVGDMWVIP